MLKYNATVSRHYIERINRKNKTQVKTINYELKFYNAINILYNLINVKYTNCTSFMLICHVKIPQLSNMLCHIKDDKGYS